MFKHMTQNKQINWIINMKIRLGDIRLYGLNTLDVLPKVFDRFRCEVDGQILRAKVSPLTFLYYRSRSTSQFKDCFRDDPVTLQQFFNGIHFLDGASPQPLGFQLQFIPVQLAIMILARNIRGYFQAHISFRSPVSAARSSAGSPIAMTRNM